MDGKTLSVSAAEYPKLEGIEVGAKVKVTADATVASNEEGAVTLELNTCELETEGHADKELRAMSEQADAPPAQDNANVEGDF